MGNELSVNQAAKVLGVLPMWVYTLVNAGRLEARKENGEWRISEESVKERGRRMERRRGNETTGK